MQHAQLTTESSSISTSEFAGRAARLRPSLLSAAQRLVGAEAEDMVQEAIVAAQAALCSFSDTGRDSFAKWLHRVLRNRCMSLLRRQRRQNEVSLHAMGLEDRNAAEAYWAALAADRRRDAINKAEMISEAKLRLRFTDLSEGDQRCVLLRIQGLSFAAIARRVGAPVATVHRRVRRAVQLLQACPLAAVASPDIDHYVWRIGSQACVYYAPEKTGAALDREKLRRMR